MRMRKKWWSEMELAEAAAECYCWLRKVVSAA